MERARDELAEEAWRETTVAEGSQGPRSYLLSARRGKSLRVQEAQARRNPPGPFPPTESGRQRTPLRIWSNAPERYPVGVPWPTPGGTKQRIETEFRQKRRWAGRVETRTWAGWHHHVAMCLLGGAFLLEPATSVGGKRCPWITRPQVYRVVREMLPRERFGSEELLRWLEETQDSNERANRSHAKRRAALHASRVHPSLN